MTWTAIILCIVVLALVYIFFNYFKIKRMSEGTPDMVEMAGIIRSGANTFMKTEFRTIFLVVVIVAVIFSLFVERSSGISFLIGACMSSAGCVIGMKQRDIRQRSNDQQGT